MSAGVAKTLQLKKISLIVGFTYRGLTVIIKMTKISTTKKNIKPKQFKVRFKYIVLLALILVEVINRNN